MHPTSPTSATLTDTLARFTQELRAAGVPVSMSETVDATRALELVGMPDRETTRAVLAATLVKRSQHRRAFDTVFSVFFSPTFPEHASTTDDGERDMLADDAGRSPMAHTGSELAARLLEALRNNDNAAMQRLAGMAVDALAGMEPGRPVSGTYYLYRTLRQLNVDAMRTQLLEALQLSESAGLDTSSLDDETLVRLVRADEVEQRIRELQRILEEHIRARLVADRGPDAVAKTLRAPSAEDVDFMRASSEQMLELQRLIQPLVRTFAARLAQRRRMRHRGALDMRRTVRRSLAFGGVPADLRFRRPRVSRPEIVVLADVSGSVASFARFTLQLVYALGAEFTRVRSWVFIDNIDEVTEHLSKSRDFDEAMRTVNREADVVWIDGHSDYGHALRVFAERDIDALSPRTTVLLLGDARNNYHPSESWVVAEIRRRARAVYWLNPEPHAYWNTGDSIVGEYAQFCDGLFECRNLRQLERFVAELLHV
jgi:uncharacterized protein with von Willebrand factor type A (vWA) domain